MIANWKTRTPTATPNGNRGGARALPVEVKIVTLANVALCAAAFAVACAWGCVFPALGLSAAFAVSAVTLALTSMGGVA